MTNWCIDIKEPNEPTIAANILAKSKTDLFLCLATLLKLRKNGTAIHILGVSVEEQDFKLDNEQQTS